MSDYVEALIDKTLRNEKRRLTMRIDELEALITESPGEDMGKIIDEFNSCKDLERKIELGKQLSERHEKMIEVMSRDLVGMMDEQCKLKCNLAEVSSSISYREFRKKGR